MLCQDPFSLPGWKFDRDSRSSCLESAWQWRPLAFALCLLSSLASPGSRAPATSPALRGTAESSSTSTFGAAYGAGLALTVLGAAAVKRVSARKALRRELAVAYEDSGIDLLDNGKFAQGLPGARQGGLTQGVT